MSESCADVVSSVGVASGLSDSNTAPYPVKFSVSSPLIQNGNEYTLAITEYDYEGGIPIAGTTLLNQAVDQGGAFGTFSGVVWDSSYAGSNVYSTIASIQQTGVSSGAWSGASSLLNPCLGPSISASPTWHQTGGHGIDIAANDGITWAVSSDTNSTVWSWQDDSWLQTSGSSGTRIAVGPQDVGAYYLTRDQSIWKYNVATSSWNLFSCCATDIGVGPNDDLWVVGGDGKSIFHYVSGSWILMPGQASRITVSADDVAWAVSDGPTTKQQVFYYSPTAGNWQYFGCCATDIAVATGQNVWVIGGDGNSVWNWTSSGWKQIPGSGTNISVTPSGVPWVTDSASNISYYQ